MDKNIEKGIDSGYASASFSLRIAGNLVSQMGYASLTHGS
jgi:hypothetical protein